MKRSMSVLACGCGMAAGLSLALASGAQAAGGTLSGSGTAASPYLVSDYADLAAIGGSYSAKAVYRLASDIDASSSATAYGGSGFSPVVFRGTFHGAGYAIRNLTIHRAGTPDIGLFSYLDTMAVVDSLVLEGVSVRGSDAVGGLVAYNRGKVSDCSVSGSVWGDSASYVGGLVGYQMGTIVNSHSTANVGGRKAEEVGGLIGLSYGGTVSRSSFSGAVADTGASAIVGGFAGMLQDASVDSCSSSGSVTAVGDSSRVGGWVGLSSGARIMYAVSGSSAQVSGAHGYAGGLIGLSWDDTILGSYATGNVTSGEAGDAGGLFGAIQNSIAVACYATGAVTGPGENAYAGGLVADNEYGQIYDSYATGSVKAMGSNSLAGGFAGLNGGVIYGCYASGNVAASVSSILGGFTGGNQDSIVSSYWSISASGLDSGVGGAIVSAHADVQGLSAAQMREVSSYSGWNFESTWSLAAGDSAPRLRVLASAITSTIGAKSLHGMIAPTWTVSGRCLTVSVADAFEVTLRAVSGRMLSRVSGIGTAKLELPVGMMAVATVRTSRGQASFLVPVAH